MKRVVYAEDVKELINGLDSLPWEEEVDDLVNSLSTVEAEPVVHGKWIDGGCSNCGAYMPTDSFWDYISEKECKFCYSCGAKMDGGVSDD